MRIGVLPVTDGTHRAESLAQTLTERLRTELLNTGRFRVIDKTHTDEAIAELRLQEAERAIMDAATIKHLGKRLGVEGLVFTKLTDKVTDLNMEGTLDDIETGEVRAGGTTSIPKRGLPRVLVGGVSAVIDQVATLVVIFPFENRSGVYAPQGSADQYSQKPRSSLESALRGLHNVGWVEHIRVDPLLGPRSSSANAIALAKKVDADLAVLGSIEDVRADRRRKEVYGMQSDVIVAHATARISIFQVQTGEILFQKNYTGQCTFEASRFTNLADPFVAEQVAASFCERATQDPTFSAALSRY
jgi:hypothetical protein